MTVKNLAGKKIVKVSSVTNIKISDNEWTPSFSYLTEEMLK